MACHVLQRVSPHLVRVHPSALTATMGANGFPVTDTPSPGVPGARWASGMLLMALPAGRPGISGYCSQYIVERRQGSRVSTLS